MTLEFLLCFVLFCFVFCSFADCAKLVCEWHEYVELGLKY